MIRFIVTVGWSGLIRPAPGTWGSAFAVLLGWLLHGLAGPVGLIAGTVVAFGIGWWAIGAHARETGLHDPGEVVIDELVGQWIALWPLSIGLAMANVGPWVFPWPGWVGAFVAFRLFDILKPGPIGWADRRDDALGVMLDDVFAGIGAAVCVVAAAAIAHGWLA